MVDISKLSFNTEDSGSQSKDDSLLRNVQFDEAGSGSTAPESDWGDVLTKTLENVPTRFKRGFNAIQQDLSERFGRASSEARYQGYEIADQLLKNPNDIATRQTIEEYGVNPDDILSSDERTSQDAQTKLAESYRTRAVKESPKMQSLIAEANDLGEEIRKNSPVINDRWSAKGITSSILGAGVEMIPAIATTLITKKPMLGSSVMGGHVYGQALAEGNEMGLNPVENRSRAITQALTETFTESIPLGQLIKPGTGFLKDMAKTGLSEGLQESVTQTVNEAYDAGIVGEDTSLGEALENIAYSFVVGAGTGSAMSGATYPLRPKESLDPLSRQIADTVNPLAAEEGDALTATLNKTQKESEQIKQEKDTLSQMVQEPVQQEATEIQEVPDRLEQKRQEILSADSEIPQGSVMETLRDSKSRSFGDESLKNTEVEAPKPILEQVTFDEPINIETVPERLEQQRQRIQGIQQPKEEVVEAVEEEAPQPEEKPLTVQERREKLMKSLDQQRAVIDDERQGQEDLKRLKADFTVLEGEGEAQQALKENRKSPTPEQLIKRASEESGPTPGELEFRRMNERAFLDEAKKAKIPEGLGENGVKLMNNGYRNALRGYRSLAQKVSRQTKVAPEVDTISEAITKMGGLNRKLSEQEGIDKATMKRNKLFPSKGGMTFDESAELLNEKGYRNREGGKLSANDVVDLVSGEVNNGELNYSVDVDPEFLSNDADMMREWARELGGTENLNKAITKALKGEKLGKRQAEVVGEIIDIVNATRSEQVNDAKETLAARRKERREGAVKTHNDYVKEIVNTEPVKSFEELNSVVEEMPEEYNEADEALHTIIQQAEDTDPFETDSVFTRLENGEITEDQAMEMLTNIIEGKTNVESTERQEPAVNEPVQERQEETKPEPEQEPEQEPKSELTTEEVTNAEPVQEEQVENNEVVEPVEQTEEATPEASTEPEAVETEETAVNEESEPYTFDFGKHKGKTLDQVPDNYLDWVMSKEKQFNKTKPELINAIKELRANENESDTSERMERDSAVNADAVGQNLSEDEKRVRISENLEKYNEQLEEGRNEPVPSVGVPESSALDVGAQSDTRVSEQDNSTGTTPGVTGSADSRGNPTDGTERIPTESPAVEAVLEQAKQRSADARSDKQIKADKVPVVFNDASNIDDTLPLLTPEQRTDVVKAEQRLYGSKKKGILFTNGTGTGKTYTGGGIIKRAVRANKKVLLVAPSNTIPGWIGASKDLQFDLNELPNKKTGLLEGQNAVVTSYQNFADNQALLETQFDLVVYDESHKIMANMQGKRTNSAAAHFAITNKNGESRRGSAYYAKDIAALNKDIKAHIKAEKAKDNKITEAEAYQIPKFAKKRAAINKKIDAMNRKFTKLEKKNPTKTVFLSASPFSGHMSVMYADGYLFDTNEGYKESGGYNSGNHEQQFLVKNFGYRMKYNRANAPGPEVNVGLLERDWADQMFSSGAMVGRKLDVPHDYSRQFPIVDQGVGKTVDNMFEVVNYKDYPLLSETLRIWRKNGMDRQLTEALRGAQSTDRIKQHLDMGRKVVVFHKRMNIDIETPLPKSSPDEKTQAEINKLKKTNPEFFKLNLGLTSVPETMVNEFGDRVGLFNGENKKERNNNLKEFNKDDGKIDILVVSKDAGKEGLSAHDITGNHQRALMIMNTPESPADAIQMEGRVYRHGLKSNAVIEYPSVQTNFEKIQFREVVSTRTATAENLAMGGQSRMLREAFREGYLDPYMESPNGMQGIGGKQADNNTHEVTALERAKTYYYKRAKKTQATKAQEGADYFATPEPVGMAMVNLANVVPGEKAMEPSAGHGAIARFLPETTSNLMIEQSPQLIGELAMVTEGEVKHMDFEDLNLINKFDVIPMNPPFGKGGAKAIKHIDKAFKHLNNGGRIVAIYPEGPMADKAFDKWYEKQTDAYMVGEIHLPGSTFGRAGTGVMTRIIMIDKDTTGGKAYQGMLQADYSKIDDINELFNRINELESVPRPDVSISANEAGLSLTESDGKYTATLTEFNMQGPARRLGKRELKKIATKYFGEVENKDTYWKSTEYSFDTFKDRNNFLKAVVEQGSPKRLAKLEPTSQSKGVSHEVIRNEVNKFQTEYAGVLPVKVAIVESQANLPIDMDPSVKVKALYNPGDISMVVVAENFNTAQEVQEAIRHELLVHYGFRALMGRERFNMHLDRFVRTKDPKVIAVMDQVKKDYAQFIDTETQEGKRLIAEEAIAQIAESNESPSVFKKFVNAILNGMKKIGILQDSATYIDALNLIQANADGLRSRVISRDNVTIEEQDESYGLDKTPYLASLSKATNINAAPVSDDVKSHIKNVLYTGDNRSFVERVKDKLKFDKTAARQAIIDQFASIEKYEIEKFGQLQSAENSAYKMASLSTDTAAIVETALKHGVPTYQKGGQVKIRDDVKPLQEVFGQITDIDPDMLQVWGYWMAAQRVKDQKLIQKGKEKLFTQDMIDTIDREVNADPRLKKAFQQAQKDYAGFNKAVLDFATDAGLLNQAQRDLWEHDSYVPFYRVAEEATKALGPGGSRGIAGQSAGIRELKGGEGKLNIIENMVQNPMHLISSSYKNIAMQQVVDLTEDVALTRMPMNWKPIEIDNRQIEKAMENLGIEFDSLTAEERKQYSTMFQMNAPTADNVVSVMREGKREYYEVADQLLLNSVTALGPQPTNEILQLLGIPKRLLTNLVTSTPPFMVRNFIRDTMSNFVQADKATGTTTKDTVLDVTMLRPLTRGIKGFNKSLKEDSSRWKIMAAGGMSGEYFGSNTEDIASSIIKPSKKNLKESSKKLFNMYQKVIRASEEATRIATFDQVKANGGTDMEAAYQAKNVINFSRRGQHKVIEFLIATVPFFNARIQGLDRLYTGAQANKGSFALRGALLFAASAALMALNDDREEYWALNEFDRDANWHFWIDGVHYRIPKPFEVGSLFATIPERIYEAMTRDEGVFLDRMGSMFLNTFSMNPIPQAFSPIVEQVANRNFFYDRPIVSMSLQNLKPEMQYTNRTSEMAKFIAQSMPDFMPDWSRSPVRVEALVNSYFGTVGSYVLTSGDSLAKMTGDTAIAPARRHEYDYYIINDFVREGVSTSKYVGRLYEMAEEANKTARSIKDLEREGRMEEANELKKEYGSILKVRRIINRKRGQLSDINARIKRIYSNTTMSAERKRKMLDMLTEKKNRIAKEINDKYYRLF